MCLDKPHSRTDEQFFWKEVNRTRNGEMKSPHAETILHERIGKWQSHGFLRSLLRVYRIKNNTAFNFFQLGKMFVHRRCRDPTYTETWLVESASKRALCNRNAAALGKFRFLGQVIDESWYPDERNRLEKEKRSAAAKKGWETRRANQKEV